MSPRLTARVVLVAAAGLGACDRYGTDVPIVAPQGQAALAVRDQTPRPRMAVPLILAALADRERSDGTLIVGVKEGAAARGVGIRGETAPPAVRLAAENAIRGAFPSLTVVRGIVREGFRTGPFGPVRDTVFATGMTVRLPEQVAPGGHAGILEALFRHPNVDYVTPNFTNGTTFADQNPYGIGTVRADQAWAQGQNGAWVDVAIVDTGIDSDGYVPGDNRIHPDFASNRVMLWNGVHSYADNACGTSSTSADPCYWEHVYHGTGVAGAFVAEVDGTASKGVAPGVANTNGSTWQIWVGKVYYRDVYGYERLPQDAFASAVLRAGNQSVSWFAQPRIGVTSVGYLSTDEAAYQMLRDAFATSYHQHGVLWFAAAGNCGPGAAVPCATGNIVVIPARFPDVVAVSSVESNLTLSTFSSTGPQVELAAPGGYQRLSWNRRDDRDYFGTRNVRGTSFAAPMAAGVARIVLSANPGLTAPELRQRLTSHVRDLGAAGRDNSFGYGLVDAICALQQKTPCP